MARVDLPAHLFKSLHLSNPQNYNIYLIGSRLWGTNSATSDWDLLVVGDVPPGHHTSLHKSQYDITLLSRQEFIEQVNQGSLLEVVCALMRKDDMVQRAFDVGNLQINVDSLKTWLAERQEKDLAKAEKFWLKGNQQSGWKILRHILHGRALYNHLIVALRGKRVTFSIDDIQTIVQPATLLCDKNWMQLDWPDAHTAMMDVLQHL